MNSLESSSGVNKWKKIDENGKYKLFYGYTVISFLKERDSDDWKNFFNYVKNLKIFNKYFSLLPLESLHVTIKNHICVTDSNWVNYTSNIAEQITTKSANVCNIMDITPVCSVAKLYTSHSLGVFLNMENDAEVQKLRKILVLMGMKPEENFKFHMTFAYKYKEVPESEKFAFDMELNNIYMKLKHFVDKRTLKFEKAKYCGFLSMEEYVPIKTE